MQCAASIHSLAEIYNTESCIQYTYIEIIISSFETWRLAVIAVLQCLSKGLQLDLSIFGLKKLQSNFELIH